MTWLDRVKEASVRGSFSEEEHYLARHWPTCPCGELSSLMRWTRNSGPVDPHLWCVGMAFSEAVSEDNVVAAAHYLALIYKLVGKP